ncbi:hypothetical protein THAOC_24990 [Thalassiosira oceanica]|uniref:Uncharacterized protein n=1 Tax=Thalassiosira oceanica TaxID=159749 RepID=K0S976_THAOC|nr:hypothetical protein THAOC_24990 [Thalassiosira oceanica]|eukprot:EJK55292.1 hypothetical protein THAOC_24990 [Thalassiosira oceanica]
MLGKVWDPYMRRDSAGAAAQAQDKKNPEEGTIVADFVARDCPATTQASNDSGLGGRTNVLGEIGPFKAALGEFHTGNFFPIVVGVFGEVNEDASKLITKLARLTAKTDFGKSMSPLVSHSKKGGAFPIMQSQFRRVQAQHLLKRRHTPDSQYGKLIKQRRTITVNTEPDREPACLAGYAP